MSPASRKYSIQNQEYCFSAGRIADGHQVLIVIDEYHLTALTLLFNDAGDFVRSETTKFPETLHDKNLSRSDRSKTIDAEMKKLQSSLGFVPGTIEVSKFYFKELGIGITDLPQFMQKAIDDPEDMDDWMDSEEEKQDFLNDIENWKKAKKFIFVWGKEFWMDADGEVEPT